MTLKMAAAVRHVGFEDLGSFQMPIERAGYEIRYYDIGEHDLSTLDAIGTDLLIVLGGPVGVYETDTYPFLADEIAILEKRLDADRPTLGVCLGAQLMARALGSSVYPGAGKEIGWAPLTLTEAGYATPLAHLDGAPVLHWHGDTFDLPAGCDLLASTDVCRNQAFARGTNVLGLQFHAEARARGFERWLVGHACELGVAGIDPGELRAKTEGCATGLEERAAAMIGEWLEFIW